MILICVQHGDEVVGREMLLRLLVYLCEQYDNNDPTVVALVDNTDMVQELVHC